MTVSLILEKTKLLPKRNALAKPQARRCLFLVVWIKLNYRCTASQKPRSILKAMKHERWLLNCGKTQVWLKSPFLCNFTSKKCSGALMFGKQFTYKFKWVHKPYCKIIEHKCTNWENQSPGNGAFLQKHIKKGSLGQIKRLLYKSR